MMPKRVKAGAMELGVDPALALSELTKSLAHLAHWPVFDVIKDCVVTAPMGT